MRNEIKGLILLTVATIIRFLCPEFSTNGPITSTEIISGQMSVVATLFALAGIYYFRTGGRNQK